MIINKSIWKDKRFLSLRPAEKLAIIAGYASAITTASGPSFNWIMAAKAMGTENTDPVFSVLKEQGWIDQDNIITRTEYLEAEHEQDD